MYVMQMKVIQMMQRIYIYIYDVAVDDVGDGKDRTDVGHANDACDVDEVHVDDVFGNSSFWKKTFA